MLHTSGGIQVFRAADRSLSTYQYKSFLKIIKWNRGKSENYFSRENKFSPSPRTPLPLSKKAVFFGGVLFGVDLLFSCGKSKPPAELVVCTMP